MSAEPAITKPTFIVRFIRITVRLLLILIFGGALGAGLYFGTSALYQQYTRVIEDHAARLDALESRQLQNSQLTLDRLENFQDRIETLEIQGDTDKDALADLQSRFDALEETQTNLLADTNLFSERISTVEQMVDKTSSLGEKQATLQNQVEELSRSIDALDEQSSRLDILYHDFQILRAMELVTRARLNLMSDNLTLARSDIKSSRDILALLQTIVPDYQTDTVIAIMALLDDALDKLPNFPVSTADKLEGAWALLIEGLPPEEKPATTPDA
ncbi:MAG: hypothetical protein IMY76_04950 [Chloroflexi bacterium]|nr:hypothetical protein [Chloroflexota bacterium]